MMTSYAITYTVKNDLDLLRTSCIYHLEQGCSRIYIFDDGSEDGTIESISDLDNIVILKSNLELFCENEPSWINDIKDRWYENFDVRKRINTYNACILARDEGIEWVASIDSDEAIYLSSSGLSDFLSRVDRKVDQILLRNHDAIIECKEIVNPFVECTSFKVREPITELVWKLIRRILTLLGASPKKIAWYDYIFFFLRFLGQGTKLVKEPDGQYLPIGYYLGYVGFKSIIRTSSFEGNEFIIHKWKSGSKINSIVEGKILHYDMYNYSSYYNKFSQRTGPMLLSYYYLRFRLAMIIKKESKDASKDFFNKAIIAKQGGNKLFSTSIRIKYVSDCLEHRIGEK